jgi:dUTP pyrophosphatase
MTDQDTQKTPEEIAALQDAFTTQGDDSDNIANQFNPKHFKQPPVLEQLQEFMMNNDPLSSAPVVELKIQQLPNYEGLPYFERATMYSSGIDLFAANYDTLLLNSIGATVLVPTGIKMEVPVGYEIQIRPRSGLALKHGLTVLNSPGTIDADYRGEIGVILTKLTTGKFKVERGERIAQMVLCPVVYPKIVYVDELSETVRGDGGFGHSGT